MTKSPAQRVFQRVVRAGQTVVHEVSTAVREMPRAVAVPVPERLTPGYWLDRAGDWVDEALADVEPGEDQHGTRA